MHNHENCIYHEQNKLFIAKIFKRNSVPSICCHMSSTISKKESLIRIAYNVLYCYIHSCIQWFYELLNKSVHTSTQVNGINKCMSIIAFWDNVTCHIYYARIFDCIICLVENWPRNSIDFANTKSASISMWGLNDPINAFWIAVKPFW